MEAGIEGTAMGLPANLLPDEPPVPPQGFFLHLSPPCSPAPIIPSQPLSPLFSNPRHKMGTPAPSSQESDLHTRGLGGGGVGVGRGQASSVPSETRLYTRLAKAAYFHICMSCDLIQGHKPNDLHVLLRQILEVVLLLGRHGHRLLTILRHQATHVQTCLTGRCTGADQGQIRGRNRSLPPKISELKPLTTTGDSRQFRSKASSSGWCTPHHIQECLAAPTAQACWHNRCS